MEKNEFVQVKLKFINAELEEKIAIYTQTTGLTTSQYKELLQHYPSSEFSKLEKSMA